MTYRNSLHPHVGLAFYLPAHLTAFVIVSWSSSAASLAHLQSPACAPSCDLPASQVWGQYGSFRTTSSNNPVIPTSAPSRCTVITVLTPASACTLSEPWSALADAHGNLFIADTANNRVLEYDDALASRRQDATRVYGQEGSFISTFGNLDGVTASSLWHPLGLALDPAGGLWVADFYNMRMLAFATPGSSMVLRPPRCWGRRGYLLPTGVI